MKKNIGLFAILLALVGVSVAGDGKIFSVGSTSNYFRVNSDGTAEFSGVVTKATGAGAYTTLSASGAVSGAGFTALFASPPAIGGTAAAAGAFTTLSASSTVSGTGFSTYLASPPAIGGTAPAAGSFTTLGAGQNVTFNDAGSVARVFTVSDDFKHVVTPLALGTVTNTQALGAVSSIYTISAAGSVTCTVANASVVGQQFTIINTGAQTITFETGGNIKGAEIALTADDSVFLYSADGTNWWPIAKNLTP